jgi:hypothetical protein
VGAVVDRLVLTQWLHNQLNAPVDFVEWRPGADQQDMLEEAFRKLTQGR